MFSYLICNTAKIPNTSSIFTAFKLDIFITIKHYEITLQDYHWWWKSFIVSGGSAVYILIYSIFYFFTKLEITEFIPTLLYIGYTGKFYKITYQITASVAQL